MDVAPATAHPAPEEDPAAQVTQVMHAVAPAVPTYVPSTQLVQDAELVAALYEPAAQMVHTRLAIEPVAVQPTAEKPTAHVAHVRQALAPVALA